MPARTYDSLSDAMGGIRGWKNRTALAHAKNEARKAEIESDAFQAVAARRRIVGEDLDLRRAMGDAEARLTRLQATLQAAKTQARNLEDQAIQSGDMPTRILAIRARIVELPALIVKAEADLAAARQAHADHVARHAPAPVVEDLAPAKTAPTMKARHK